MKKNKSALTVEQLKALPVREWVWIEVLEPFEFEEKTSAYYRKQEDYTHNKAFICGYPGISFGFDFSDYNKTWVAYTEQPLLRCENCEYFLSSVDLCKKWGAVTDNDGFCHRGKPRCIRGKQLDEEEIEMYYITCFSKCEKDDLGWFDGGATRTFGCYDNLEVCKEALNGNWCDMHELLYKYAVVERIGLGIHPVAVEEAWFKWDEEKQGFYEIPKPECTEGFCNHAFG